MTGKRMERAMRADWHGWLSRAARLKPHNARSGGAWRRGGRQNLKREARDGRNDAGVAGWEGRGSFHTLELRTQVMETKEQKVLLQELAEQAYEGKLLLFIGAGFSKCVVGPKVALSWLQLLEKVADRFEVKEALPCLSCGQPLDCPQIASNMVKCLAEKPGMTWQDANLAIKEYVCFLCNWYPDREQKTGWGEIFDALTPSIIVTTNYDHVLSELLEEKAEVIDSSMTLPSGGHSQVLIYHLHGIRTVPDKIVLTREDYIEALRPFSYRQVKLATLLRENSVVFIGYGKNDLNVLSAMDMAAETFKDVKTGKSDRLYVQFVYQNTCTADCAATRDERSAGTYVLNTSDVMETLSRLARECTSYKTIQKERYEHMIAQVKNWTINERADKNGMQQRRSNIFNLFENNISLLNSQTKLGREFNAQFDELFKSYFRKVRKDAKKRGKFYRYADLWAMLNAYFSMLVVYGDRETLSPNTRRFKYAIGWLNGIAWVMGEERNKAHLAYKWFCEDWAKFDERIKDVIKTAAKINPRPYEHILDLINRCEAKIMQSGSAASDKSRASMGSV